MIGGPYSALQGPRFDPYRLPNNAAIYSVQGAAGDASYILSGGNCVLVADRSGNSAVNGLVLNGASGQYASTPDAAALDITGDIDLRGDIALDDWTPSVEACVIGKWLVGTSLSYALTIATNGCPTLGWTEDGTTIKFLQCPNPTGLADFARRWVRGTLDVDNGATGRTANFYTSSDGATWTLLGSSTAAGVTSIASGTAAVTIGARTNGSENRITGIVYRAQIYNGIGGTLAFDANFTAQPKTLTNGATFTESSSNAATVTLNSSGDFGARICGARDLVQLTASKQPAFSTGADGVNLLTFAKASSQYLKAAPFPLVQPNSVYYTGSATSWTGGATFFDGNTNDKLSVQQRNSSPQLNTYLGSGYLTSNSADFPLSTRWVMRLIANGASSSIGRNRDTANSGGNPGTASAGGFIVGCRPDGTNPIDSTMNEILVRSVADDTALQNRIASYEIRTLKISA